MIIRLVNFFFALYIPTALNTISWRLYIIFAAISFAAAIWTWALQVETANRSLEEMDAMFEGKTMWAFADTDLTTVKPTRHLRFASVDTAVEDMPEKHGATGIEKV